MKLNRRLAAAVVSLIICVSAIAQKISFQGRVIDVIDGATLIVETQSKTRFVVRCQAISVPRNTEPYADDSKQRLSNAVLRQTVAVEYTERNEYGHLVGTIFLNGKDVCLDQVVGGLAWFDSHAPSGLPSSRRELYAGSEQHARNSGIGVWTPSATAQSTTEAATNGATNPATSSPDVNQSPASSSVVAPDASNNSGTVDVRGFFRKDGTYVAPHKRTAPDASFDNNWTTAGNVNPYTGKPGTKSWFARNWWIFPTVGALIGTSFLLHRSTGGGIAGGIPCNDGTISQAQHRQGACSHHGGIR